MFLRECPCKYCISRSVGCHAFCDAYKLWKHESDIYNEKVKKVRYEENEDFSLSLAAERRKARRRKSRGK